VSRQVGEVSGRDRVVLVLDAVVNIALGLPLVFYSRELAGWLGLPIPRSAFYPSILGAVLTGIGVALLVECFGDRSRLSGLGLAGALCVNLCGAAVLAVWLARGSLGLPIRGYVFLWAIVAVVGGLSAVELSLTSRRRRGG
jgi:hypothetical protein